MNKIEATFIYYDAVVMILFVLSLSILIVSAVNYLKVKDEQKKEKAKKIAWRFFIIFTIVFVFSLFWFMMSLYTSPTLLV